MGVELPPTLKLSNDALEKKLASALSAAQEISTLGKFPINPSKLPLWKVSDFYQNYPFCRL